MGRTLKDIMDALPEDERAIVDARYTALREEYETLSALRQELSLSQDRMATLLNISQPAISKMEKSHDMLLSTVRNYVEAMGCDLDIAVRTKEGKRVRIHQLSDLTERGQKEQKGTVRARPVKKGGSKLASS